MFSAAAFTIVRLGIVKPLVDTQYCPIGVPAASIPRTVVSDWIVTVPIVNLFTLIACKNTLVDSLPAKVVVAAPVIYLYDVWSIVFIRLVYN